MQALALDIGDARVGVACGSTRTGIAMPVCVLPAHEVFSHAPSFRRVVEDHEPDVLVVGRQLTMQGEPGPQAQKLTEIGQKIAQRLGLEVEFVDERLTSSEAKRILREQGVSRTIPKWLELDAETLTGKVVALPQRDDIDLTIEEHLIVEFYSR